MVEAIKIVDEKYISIGIDRCMSRVEITKMKLGAVNSKASTKHF